ncbi:MFS transporter [Loigolactobacillus jiayinensis]|uniref:MFS transporter n=1 Tax=Loigolactobacillus jiayinensis TaxID=2486016 RepID=A0ABW1RCX1_9LACO|nr:MFS transporter [Loigolactobacillus jiayinensis]
MAAVTKQVSFQHNPQVQKNRWWILVAVGLFTFMSTLDGSIVNIALPVMSHDLKIPMNQAEWVVSIYLIVVCALLLLFGKLGDVVGKIRIFRIGTFFFVLGSLLCGFNQSLTLLLLARGLQAFGASMTMSTNNGIITEIFPISERGKALGFIGSFVSLGSIAGPGIGGLILSVLPWGYIFWLNVPIGILTMFLGHKILPKDLLVNHKPIDFGGFILFMLMIVSLFVGIFLGQQIGFTQPLILSLFLLAIIMLGVFIWFEPRQKEPLIAFKLFHNSAFTLSLIVGFLIFITNFFFNVISPFYLENARALSPRLAGYILMMFPIVQVIASPLAGSIADRIGSELLTFIGLVVISISQIGYALTNLETPLWLFMLFVGLVGLGNGVFQAPNNTMVMSSVTANDLGIAGGINALARNLGMVFGISISTTVLYGAMSHNYGQHVTTYLAKRPDVFIYGMHVAFTVALVVCLVATVLTGVRLWCKRVK